MPPFFALKKLVIATHNAGKVKEFAALINHDELCLVAAGDLGLPEPEETGTSFSENAALKSRAACIASGFPALADDSGLSVDGLDGLPGIYSARWAVNKDFRGAFEKIKCLLTEKDISPDGAKASFVCALALTLPHQEPVIAQGRIDGRLCFPPRGKNGFGYDPIFIPVGDTRSFAQMSAQEKQGYSHRAAAIKNLCLIVNGEP